MFVDKFQFQVVFFSMKWATRVNRKIYIGKMFPMKNNIFKSIDQWGWNWVLYIYLFIENEKKKKMMKEKNNINNKNNNKLGDFYIIGLFGLFLHFHRHHLVFVVVVVVDNDKHWKEAILRRSYPKFFQQNPSHCIKYWEHTIQNTMAKGRSFRAHCTVNINNHRRLPQRSTILLSAKLKLHIFTIRLFYDIYSMQCTLWNSTTYTVIKAETGAAAAEDNTLFAG